MIVWAAVAAAALAGGQDNDLGALPPTGRQALQDLLFVASMSSRDLKAWPAPSNAVGLIKTAHERPIGFAVETPARLDRLIETPGNSILAVIREQLEMRPAATNLSPSSVDVTLPDELPAPLRESVRALIQCIVRANEEIQGSLGTLNAEERRGLIEGLPRNLAPASAVPLSFVRGSVRTSAELKSLLDKVDVRRMRNAGEWLHRESDRLIRSLRALAPSTFTAKLKFTAGGIKVTIAGFGDDVHDETDSVLTLDFGGRDRYSGRHGAGIGYASIFADLAGNDVYDLPDASLGVGILGIGIAFDYGGRDHVASGSLGQGAGVAGVGFFQSGLPSGPRTDGSTFSATAFAQGFGLAGIGVMTSFGGDADFRVRYLGQGAGVEAGVGWFGRKGGSDVVHSSGLPPSVESERILRSRGQGFGGASGIGVFAAQSEALLARAGTESQGHGADEGVGMFLSSSGPVTLIAGGYAQGSGVRRGVGVLWSQSEGDEYRIGEVGAGQGYGGDGGIGVILDIAGSDAYFNGGGHVGSASYGGLGLAFDFEGDDRYLEVGRLNSWNGEGSGVGLRLDVTGASTETNGIPGPRFDVGRLNGMFAQTESRQEITPLDEPTISAAIPLSSREKIAAAVKAAAGLDPFAGRTQRAQAMKDLAAGPDAVLDWVLDGVVNLERAEWEAVGSAMRAAPSDLRRKCADAVGGPDLARGRRALLLAAYGAYPEAIASARAALERDELAEAACLLLANLNEQGAANDLLPRCASPDPAIRRAAVAALATLGGPEAAPTLQALIGDIDPLVRRRAIAGRAKVRPENLPSLQSLVAAGDELSVRGAIGALAQIGTHEALQIVGPLLGDPRAGVRVEALMALRGRVPVPFRSLVEACRADPDARVRAVAIWVDPGRPK